jgi:CRISPR type I-E-associated protein CasB/Cse2
MEDDATNAPEDPVVERPGKVVAHWWRRLHPDERGRGGDRAGLAQLRRAATANDVLVLPAAIALWGDLRKSLGRQPNERETEAIAVIAGSLAHIKVGGGAGAETFATMLGRPAERPAMSGSRFAVLLRAEGGEERLRHLRHAIALLGGTPFRISRFAEDVLYWDDRRRRDWIFQYYQQGAAAPRPASADIEEGAEP